MDLYSLGSIFYWRLAWLSIHSLHEKLLQVFKNKTIELLLVAAGGGGASSNSSSQSSDFDAQGLLYPRKDYRNSIKVTDLRDDAGNLGCHSL